MRLAKRKFPDWGMFVLFLVPVGVGLIQRLSRPNHWFRDYDAFSCAASRIIHHSRLYLRSAECLLRKPTPYVYPPYFAHAWAMLQHSTGLSGAAALYGGAYFFLLFYILRTYVGGSLVNGPIWLRACLLTVIGADVFVCGNIAVIVHGVIALCAVFLWEYPAVLAIAIIAAATIKPVFLVYCAVFLLHPMRLHRKAFYSVISVLGGLAPFFIFMEYQRSQFVQDIRLLHYYTMVNDRGYGFLNIMSYIGLHEFDMTMLIVYGVFVTILVSAAIYIVKATDAPVHSRIWLGITVSILADPRLMFYDFLTFAPGVVSVVGLSQRLGRNTSRVINLYVVMLSAVSGLYNSRGGQYGLYLYVPGICVLILGIAAVFVGQSVLRRQANYAAVES